MNPVTSLRRIIAKQSTGIEQATVVSVTPEAISVRTSSGVRQVKAAGSETYRPGDTVRLQNNVIVGKTFSASNIPVFRV